MKEFFGKFKKIFNKQERIRFSQLIVMLIVGAIMETGVIYLMLPFATALMDLDSIMETGWVAIVYNVFNMKDARQIVIFLAILIAALYIIKSVYQYYVYKLKYRYIAKKRSELSSRVFTCLVHKPYSYHLHVNTAAIQQITVQDIDRLFNLVNAIFTIIANLFTGILVLSVLLITDVVLTVICALMIVLVMFLVNKIIVKQVAAAGEKNTFYYVQQIKWINQTTGGLKGIYANKRQNIFINKYTECAQSFAKVTADFQTLSELPKRTVEGICMSGIFLIVAGIVSTKADIASMLPVFATFAMAAYRLMPVANSVNESINTVRYHKVSLDSIYNVLEDSGVDIDEKYDIIHKERPLVYAETLKDGIEVRHMSFCYDDADQYLFHDLSMKIPAQKAVAFVGTTGAGKTTLADIILGLQIPQIGEITVDGINIAENMEWWADRIGYIPQYIYLCDDTIRANVAFAVPNDDVDDERVWACLEKAQLKEFVEALPGGLDTITGENGVRLSGGQRQRIGIARALYNDPPFLVMDEATSALDNETEAAIIAAINQLAGEKTLLIIAHRLTTIRDCDIIYRIEHGKILVEKGIEFLQ